MALEISIAEEVQTSKGQANAPVGLMPGFTNFLTPAPSLKEAKRVTGGHKYGTWHWEPRGCQGGRKCGGLLQQTRSKLEEEGVEGKAVKGPGDAHLA